MFRSVYNKSWQYIHHVSCQEIIIIKIYAVLDRLIM